jgi:hypothetical protein
MRFILSVVILTSLLGCSYFHPQDAQTNTCPPPVYLDQPVAEELKKIPQQGFENLWAWLAKIHKLNTQLEACR